MDQIPASCDREKVLFSNFPGKQRFLCTRKVLILGLKAEKQLQNENHTEDLELQSWKKLMAKRQKTAL